MPKKSLARSMSSDSHTLALPIHESPASCCVRRSSVPRTAQNSDGPKRW